MLWHKETRNENGTYIRNGDWGVADHRVSKERRDNYTDVTPPKESIKDGIPCDWDAKTGAWVLATNEAYKELRQKEYPDIGDQLDALWKQHIYDRLNGKEMIQEVDDVIGSILAVKAKYPKKEDDDEK